MGADCPRVAVGFKWRRVGGTARRCAIMMRPSETPVKREVRLWTAWTGSGRSYTTASIPTSSNGDRRMLHHLKQNWRSWFIAFLCVVFAATVVCLSDAFQQCMNQSYYAGPYYEPPKGIAQIVATLGWSKVCTGKFLKEDGEAITAFFTLVVGFFTAALWLSTRALWQVTNDTLAHAERTSVRELRAYISIKEIEMAQFRGPSMLSINSPNGNFPGEIQNYRISASLENGGQTPIRNGFVNINHVLRVGDLPKDFSFPDGKKTERAAIGARGGFSTPGIFIPISDVQTVVAKTNRLFVWGWIDYDDVFEGTVRRRTEFCFDVEADARPDGNNIYMRFIPYDRFNGADGDCMRGPRPYEETAAQAAN